MKKTPKLLIRKYGIVVCLPLLFLAFPAIYLLGLDIAPIKNRKQLPEKRIITYIKSSSKAKKRADSINSLLQQLPDSYVERIEAIRHQLIFSHQLTEEFYPRVSGLYSSSWGTLLEERSTEKFNLKKDYGRFIVIETLTPEGKKTIYTLKRDRESTNWRIDSMATFHEK